MDRRRGRRRRDARRDRARVYLGGALTGAARPEASFVDKVPALQVDDVGVFYGKALALQGVSLHVHEGEFVSLVGLNGAGKTTLFDAISGLVPSSGEIRWAGTCLRPSSPAAIACSGVVQCPETRELFGEMSVRENLDLGGNRLADGEREQRLQWLFDLFPILRTRHAQIARTLSGDVSVSRRRPARDRARQLPRRNTR
jgi:branched-chain amino acid transport system ATP-binding protein